jgi:UDP-N-acetylmuramate dehydrogenase
MTGSKRGKGAGPASPRPAKKPVKKPVKKPAAQPGAAPPPAAAAPKRGKAAAAARGAALGFPAATLAGPTRYDEPLARHTTFRIGGPAQIHFSPSSTEGVAAAVDWAKRKGVPWLVLGLGSNVLIRDGGFPGLVIKIGKGLDTLTEKGPVWKAGAGLPTPLLARRAADAGMAGVQRLVGVPGTVGGGVFMNAGAHGQDFASVLVTATLLSPEGEVVERARKAISFTYRRSGLEGHVVLGCAVRLEEEEPAGVKADLAEVLKRRRAGTPFDQPCCGSVFKNPPDTTAGRYIDRCGLKGRRVGGAVISELHANYIVNRGTATAEDVLKLMDIARTAVFKEFGVELELEVKVLGVPK